MVDGSRGNGGSRSEGEVAGEQSPGSAEEQEPAAERRRSPEELVTRPAPVQVGQIACAAAHPAILSQSGRARRRLQAEPAAQLAALAPRDVELGARRVVELQAKPVAAPAARRPRPSRGSTR